MAILRSNMTHQDPGQRYDPVTGAQAVVPSDTVDLGTVARAFYVGGTGDVKVDTAGGQTTTFSAVQAGQIIGVAIKRVYATGTTATSIVALGDEPNVIRNPYMFGTVAGTPGTNPTNWAITGGSLTLAGPGLDAGIPYFDIQYNTGAFAQKTIDPEPNNFNPAAPGDQWQFSMFVKLQAGALPATVSMQIQAFTSASALINAASTNITPTGSNLETQNYTVTYTLPATTAFVQPRLNLGGSGTVNVTLRLGYPQLIRIRP